eukprot:522105_1
MGNCINNTQKQQNLPSNESNVDMYKYDENNLKEYDENNLNEQIISNEMLHSSIPTTQTDINTQSMKRYLMKLGIDIGYDYDLNVLFDENNINKNEKCFERVKCILKIYDLWVNLILNNNKNINIINIY